MNIASIRDLQLFQFGVTIRVRVCRTWRPKVFKSDDQFSGLQCILVDTMWIRVSKCQLITLNLNVVVTD
ncbi:unnamed protein product [Prunus armeniaca]|uniref:Uncharacterized protein n=1 Tax=Prunus armeniaca TaxID=36596 RepID=A0A6J5W328_PRUAR|nr:unnamed protein product [Prunus armeniaca]CAB4294205.1 unnamed protein product [Prunus armeniaca]